MIQKYVLVFILIIIVIVLFLKSLNVEHFGIELNGCSNLNTTVNYWNNDDGVERDIHIVDPRDPCCIKSCINDFTNVDCNTHSVDFDSGISATPQMCHETNNDGNGKEGELRPEFKNKNIHYFLTSGCYSCIKNFKGGVDLLANPDNDPNCKKTTQA
tara:strand:+ start:3621 stop:4091 length:471 start_codon:yes stop_codon:yes gene_type:complete